MLLQRSLFPDAFEVQEQALGALDDWDLARARRLVGEARERDPGLVDIAALEACIEWLGREAGEGPVSGDLLAALFATVPEDHRCGRIDRPTADLIDRAIARQALGRAGRTRAFLDGEERLHRGAVLLVLRRASEALPLLRESLASGLDDRADLWGAFADACFLAGRMEEANEGYVRALGLAARDVDLHRLRHPDLVRVLGDLRDGLRGDDTEASARELLLPEAWIEGVLSIPPENAWLDRHVSRLHVEATLRPGSPSELRCRRFALLLYLDRSRRHGDYDEAGRLEMKALFPELFERVMQRIRRLERLGTAPLGWPRPS